MFPLGERRRHLPGLALGAMLILAACEMLAPPSEFPASAVPMAAPPAYAAWWTATEGCSGRSGSLARIRWYVVPGTMTFPTREGPKVGLWSRVGNEVRIAVAEGYLGHELVVRHEMLHALLDREGHPPVYFQQRCQLTWETWPGSTSAVASARAQGSMTRSGSGVSAMDPSPSRPLLPSPQQ